MARPGKDSGRESMPVFSLEAAKFWVALVGAIVTSVLGVLPQPPSYLVVMSAVLTSAAVYLTPNKRVDEPDPASRSDA